MCAVIHCCYPWIQRYIECKRIGRCVMSSAVNCPSVACLGEESSPCVVVALVEVIGQVLVVIAVVEQLVQVDCCGW
jgi:hypothetical protein